MVTQFPGSLRAFRCSHISERTSEAWLSDLHYLIATLTKVMFLTICCMKILFRYTLYSLTLFQCKPYILSELNTFCCDLTQWLRELKVLAMKLRTGIMHYWDQAFQLQLSFLSSLDFSLWVFFHYFRGKIIPFVILQAQFPLTYLFTIIHFSSKPTLKTRTAYKQLSPNERKLFINLLISKRCIFKYHIATKFQKPFLGLIWDFTSQTVKSTPK